MNAPDIRKDIADWTIDDINELIAKRYIEGEIFDFKGTRFQEKGEELYKDICAMANNDTSGLLVLGIDEEKNERTGYLLGFRKTGFRQETEDIVNQQVGSNLYKVEPTPKIDSRPIYEPDGKTFYVILQILGEDIKKPYFVRDTWQCYMRVGNSSRPASRSVIINLLNNFKERKNSIQRLRVGISFLKESLRSTIEELELVDPESIIKISPIDLRILKAALVSTEWFLSENQLMGGHISTHSQTRGVYARLRDLELFNLYIDAYNSAIDITNKTQLKRDMIVRQNWHPESNSTKETIAFWDGITHKTDEFLSK